MGGLSLLDDGETVLVEEIEIQNEIVYKFFEEIEEDEREEALSKALLVGCVAMRRMTVAEDMDYVEKEFNKLMGKVSQDMDNMFNIEKEGSHLNRLAKVMEEYFDKGGTVEGLLDCTDEKSPLYKMREEIKKEITNLRNDLFREEGKEETAEVTPIKGFSFEDICESKLSEFVRPFSDEMTRTSNEMGELEGRKVGDFVVSLKDRPDLKIVFETKDKGTISLPEIHRNLDDAMENRNAEYGIFVVKERDSLPKQVGYFNEYTGNHLVAVMGTETEEGSEAELLEIAYKWARNKLLYQKGVVTGVDLSKIGRQLDDIEKSLKSFSNILKQCTNAEKATAKIRETCEGARGDILSSMDEIKEEIEKAQGEVDAG